MNGQPSPHEPGNGWRVPLATGTRIDHYVIDTVLGAGGFGITYLANHEGLAKQFAIKEYFPDDFSYRDGQSVRPTASGGATYRWGKERFLAEARALAKFKHPAIVEVVSIFEANDTAYIVLAYEPGASMREWLKSLGRPVSQLELDRFLPPLLSALEEVHAQNLMHRDIAPDNILIRNDGTPVLIDFGAARESIKGVSRALSVIVKKGFSPPEQYTSDAEHQGAWTDIYALAASIYKAVTGQMPQDATERVVEDKLVSAAVLASPDFRPSFLAAIDHGLRLRAKDRPADVATWRNELFERGETHVSVKRTPPQRPDLSALDQPSPSAGSQVLTDLHRTMNPRLLYFGCFGAIGGAIAGGLCGVVLASVMTPNCFADSCLFRFTSTFSGIGIAVGMLAGVRLARALDGGIRENSAVDPH